MRVTLDYGTEGLAVEIPAANVCLLAPRPDEGLKDEAGSFRQAVRLPIASPPLKEIIRSGERVAIVIPDITRAFPSRRILPWLFEELAHVDKNLLTIVVGNGTHRAGTREEMKKLLGEEVLGACRVVQHNAFDPATLAVAGRCSNGRMVLMNREYVDAERRILLGFIEPHFMAGFSGGYKAVFPGIADIDSILHYHRAAVIADPRSGWGVTQNNPTLDQIRACGSLLPVDFLINVTLNRRQEITQYFCGSVPAAHEAGCRFVRERAMVPCRRAFPIVVTTNGGHPLDQNLYQAVKGMSAAAQIVEPGGLIICAARCADGFPDHGNFKRMLCGGQTPEAMLEEIMQADPPIPDQWQIQLLAQIFIKARLALFSQIPPEEVAKAHLEPIASIAERIGAEMNRLGRDAHVAVLPQGPMTIPFLQPHC